MITIFTTAKPFIGQMKINQINALKSWKAVAPNVEVILFGSGEGYTEVAKQLDLIHIPEVETSEQGTPLVNSMFALARLCGRYPVQAYVNCDVILLDDFLPAIRQINMDRFLLIGQRWDIDLNQEINFDDLDWRERLRQKVLQCGRLHPPAGSDYFVYTGHIWDGLATMVIGRAGYDNELIYHCLASHVPVIDASDVVMVVHQEHDYRHHPQGVDGVWYGPEAELNRRAAQGRDSIFTLLDASWKLSPDGLIRNYCRGDWNRYLRTLHALHGQTLFGGMLAVVSMPIRAVSYARLRASRMYGAWRRQ